MKKTRFKISLPLIVKTIAALIFILICFTAYSYGKESGFGADVFKVREYQYGDIASERIISSPVEDININWDDGLITVRYMVGTSVNIYEAPSEEIDENDMMNITLEGTELTVKWNENGASASKELGKSLVIDIPAGSELDSLTINGGDSKIVIENIKTDALSLNTGVGSVNLNGLISEEASVRTSSGDINGEKCQFESLYARSTDGEIELKECDSYDIDVFTGTGSVNFDGDFYSITAKTFSGNITAGTTYNPGNMNISSTSGNIKLTVPSNTEALGEYSTVSGKFVSDFLLYDEYPGVLALGNVKIEKEAEEEKKDKKEKEVNQLNLTTSSGNIELIMGDRSKENTYFQELLGEDE